MKIATGDMIGDIEEDVVIRPPRPSRPGSGGGGNRNNPNGGGGDGRSEDGSSGPEEFSPDKYKILTWFLLVVVVMTFGGLIAAYIVIATNNVAEWRPSALPKQLWFSTLVIIASSIAYHFAHRATIAEKQFAAKKWFLVTTGLAVTFLVSQVLAWFELMQRGLYMRGNPYLAFFYVLTAVHAVHVIGGITALSSVLLRSWYPTENPLVMNHRKSLAQVVGWYWHFMGALWIVLFVLLGFWK